MKSTRRCISTALLSLFMAAFSLMSLSSAAHAVAVPEGNATIRIVNSQGVPIENAKIRYQTSSWHDAGNTDANGEVVVSVPEKFSTITARAYYNGAYFDIRQNIRTNSVIEFKTIRSVVSLTNSTGDPLEGGAVKFVFSSWAEYGVTDTSGQSVMELLPCKYTFRMSYAEGQLDIKQDIGQNPEVAFSTIRVNVSLKDSTGTGLEGGNIMYVRASWKDFGTTGSDGNSYKELLASKYTFRMKYEEGQLDIKQDIGQNPEVAFSTIRVNVSLKDSSGTGLEGGNIMYVRASWKDFGTTGSDGNSYKELLASKYTFRMKYEEGQLDIKQDISQNPEVAFSTAKVAVRLEDTSGNGLEGGKVRYVRASWRDFGITGSDGNAVKQLLDGSYTFRMYAGSKYQDKKADVAGDTQILFTSTETPLKTWTLTTSASPAQGGSVVVSPAKTTYTDGEKVTFKATPAQGYAFSGYGGQDGSQITSNVLTMNGNKSVSVMFDKVNTSEEYKITPSVQPANGGTITITPSKSVYPYGDRVQISANAANGFEFVQLGGTGMGSSSITTLPYSFDITGDVTVRAIFKEVGAPETIIVHNVAELNQAEITARKGNVVILLDDGEYVLSDQFMVGGDHVTVRSLNGDASKVIVKGKGMNGNVPHVFSVYKKYFTVEDITIGWVRNHAIQVHGELDADYPVIRNVHFRDTYEQMLKVSYSRTQPDFSDGGIVENCSFIYTAGVGPQWYIGGVDAHKSKGWIVRNNLFQDIKSPTSSLSESAIHFWSGSTDTLVEKNVIIDCDRGIMFGLDNSPHYGGIIRNNFVHATRDVGIYAANTLNGKIYNNTVFADSGYFNAIEYRFADTSVDISNNLTNKAISKRDNAVATLSNNVDYASETW
ncbi:MAG: right-handed parallel beta-helix repeat-containing protein, partial [Desulfamplus sp.]|nr:right-handed parallel beta-helix repeat-containing protein [Desulfamplus sp.]